METGSDEEEKKKTFETKDVVKCKITKEAKMGPQEKEGCVETLADNPRGTHAPP